jgi:hypothetical protein
MNDDFAKLSDEDRGLAVANAALTLGIESVILEKDFWVSWLLGLLFAHPTLGPHLVFKGGTSLSKAFGVIDRFSEDIDLCLVPQFVGADTKGFDALPSRGKRDAAVLEMQRLCAEKTRNDLMPCLDDAISQTLGDARNGAWLRYELDTDAKSPIVYFQYPVTQPAGFEYLQREVKLELGTLTDQQPTGEYAIHPLIAPVYPQLFETWNARVTALELQRTFWEKATILHSEFHRPAGQPTPKRYARHYFDMTRLLTHPQASQFLSDHAQCARVVDWKGRVFARGWSRYDLARPGTFRLVPPPERQAALAQDYTQMRAMFMSGPPPFAELLERLAHAEAALNNA